MIEWWNGGKLGRGEEAAGRKGDKEKKSISNLKHPEIELVTRNHSEICSFPSEILSCLKFNPGTVILPCGAGRAGVAFHVASPKLVTF
ncbi:MAG: hypothetical protein IIB05_05495 [Bacteroidetes bacterium]|nr:hypothetical protein [Bacteroidota bacterium]